MRRRRQARRDVSGREPAAILLSEAIGTREVVVACCARALRSGVRRGMAIADARAILPGAELHVEPHDAPRDAVVLRALAAWCSRFSPRVAADPPDGLVLDVSGCAGVFGGEERIPARVERELATVGFSTRTAIAPTFAAACAIARYGDHSGQIVPDGGVAEAIGPLPIEALGFEARTLEGLHEVGLVRIEQLLRMPRSALPVRFGPELTLRLDRVLGQAIETITPIRPSEPVRVERVFDGPTTQWEALEGVTRELLASLCTSLEKREAGARTLELTLDRSDLEPARTTLSLGRPCRDPAHLWRLIRPRLERAHLGFGVEGVSLHAPWTQRVRHEQLEAEESLETPPAEVARAADELIDTLSARFGSRRVLRIELSESHVPERASRLTPWIDEGASAGSSEARPTQPQLPTVLPHHHHAETAWPDADRPSVLFHDPEAIQAICLHPDGPVASVTWDEEELRIVTSVGPERVGGEWWRRGDTGRDYFKVQDHRGRWLWVCRELASGRWFVHGVWA